MVKKGLVCSIPGIPHARRDRKATLTPQRALVETLKVGNGTYSKISEIKPLIAPGGFTWSHAFPLPCLLTWSWPPLPTGLGYGDLSLTALAASTLLSQAFFSREHSQQDRLKRPIRWCLSHTHPQKRKKKRKHPYQWFSQLPKEKAAEPFPWPL